MLETMQQVMEAVFDFLKADGLDGMQQVVQEKQTLLLGDEADPLMTTSIRQFQQTGNQRLVQALQFAQVILHDCKVNGIEAAFQHLRDVMQQDSDNEDDEE